MPAPATRSTPATPMTMVRAGTGLSITAARMRSLANRSPFSAAGSSPAPGREGDGTVVIAGDRRTAPRSPCADRRLATSPLPFGDLLVQRTAGGGLGQPVGAALDEPGQRRSEEHTSELQSQFHLVCR